MERRVLLYWAENGPALEAKIFHTHNVTILRGKAINTPWNFIAIHREHGTGRPT